MFKFHHITSGRCPKSETISGQITQLQKCHTLILGGVADQGTGGPLCKGGFIMAGCGRKIEERRTTARDGDAVKNLAKKAAPSS